VLDASIARIASSAARATSRRCVPRADSGAARWISTTSERSPTIRQNDVTKLISPT